MYLTAHLEIIQPLFDFNKFKINFPELLKQYQKINKVRFLRTLFLEFFDNTYREIGWLLDDIKSYYMAEEYKDLQKQKIEKKNIMKKS